MDSSPFNRIRRTAAIPWLQALSSLLIALVVSLWMLKPAMAACALASSDTMPVSIASVIDLSATECVETLDEESVAEDGESMSGSGFDDHNDPIILDLGRRYASGFPVLRPSHGLMTRLRISFETFRPPIA